MWQSTQQGMLEDNPPHGSLLPTVNLRIDGTLNKIQSSSYTELTHNRPVRTAADSWWADVQKPRSVLSEYNAGNVTGLTNSRPKREDGINRKMG